MPSGERIGGRAWDVSEVDLERRWNCFQRTFEGVSAEREEQVDCQELILDVLIACLRVREAFLSSTMSGRIMSGEEECFFARLIDFLAAFLRVCASEQSGDQL